MEVVCRLLKYWDINQAVIWRIIYVNILKKLNSLGQLIQNFADEDNY